MANGGDGMARVQRVSQGYRVGMGTLGSDGHRYSLPLNVGECWSDFNPIAQDLTLVRSHYQPEHPLIEETSHPHSQPMLVMTFALAGDSLYCGHDGVHVPFRRGHITMTTFRTSAGERRYQANQRVEQCRLLVGMTAIERYFGIDNAAALFDDDCLRQHAFAPISAASRHHVQALYGRTDPLDRHIHALSLLAQYRHLLVPEKMHGCPHEEIRLEQVGVWMRERLAEPLTLSCIAAQAGMSEFKLKQGFHRYFNTTPGRMLLAWRMERAQQLLEQGLQVAQTAWLVGYRHPTNFSLAFTRYFGRNPKTLSTVTKKREI
ncbi:helix-turn-helix transcriptional regulator [Pectobacterium sp. B1J-3]|uniref:helix-turn-helix transcriptional regulator n=1 Tax=Pectobacterium sp. B1J-3 TaxID=3385371 RepID=UPI003905A948